MQSVSPLLIGNELIRALETRPEYDENIRLASPAERLMALNHILKHSKTFGGSLKDEEVMKL